MDRLWWSLVGLHADVAGGSWFSNACREAEQRTQSDGQWRRAGELKMFFSVSLSLMHCVTLDNIFNLLSIFPNIKMCSISLTCP